MMMKKAILAVAITCAASSAFAVDLVFNAGAIPSAPGDYYLQTPHAAGNFSDTITFSVGQGILYSTANNLSVANAVPGATNPFSSDISNLTYSIYQGEEKFGTYSGGMSVFQTPLAAGTYNLVVSGVSDGTHGGSYGLDLSVSPVPEPTAYATLIAGLGLIGFATRRRKSDERKFG
jgi:hypothetical protein